MQKIKAYVVLGAFCLFQSQTYTLDPAVIISIVCATATTASGLILCYKEHGNCCKGSTVRQTTFPHESSTLLESQPQGQKERQSI